MLISDRIPMAFMVYLDVGEKKKKCFFARWLQDILCRWYYFLTQWKYANRVLMVVVAGMQQEKEHLTDVAELFTGFKQFSIKQI